MEGSHQLPPASSHSSHHQPATPRMLRSASNSIKNSTDQMEKSHSRNPSHSHTPGGHSGRQGEKDLMSPAQIDRSSKKHHQPSTPTQPSNHSHSSHNQQQQFHRKCIGDWDFVRTIGAGSMGKVKLAKHNSTGEKCAVKIVPRAAKLYQRAHANDPVIKSAEEAQQRQKEFEKEVARDKRTIREGALGRLLFHPHICRLYEMVPMTNHYYMLFEYVEGGQLLDYIVSHGSLNEKYARKFARGIASALDYCHKNNVVHRDLKIENIMINQKGEIKIIDFGLSNLYMPNHLLKTYCGSLYFAAPELLSAKPYTGPEVDVWSFGIVLYVLVCGKVPFDDPVVSALHEKIKKGNVEYPSFISRECVSLLSRMLVVDPSKRATLAEVLQHPWMNKGYDYLVPSYTPKRSPLTLPLDPQIIQAISTFDLGSVQSLTEELTRIVSSPDYQLSSDNWYKSMRSGQPFQGGLNPVYGFHPLVSIYYLVEEMRKRKKAKEEAIKAQQRQTSGHLADARIQSQSPAHASTYSTPPTNTPASSSRHVPTESHNPPGQLKEPFDPSRDSSQYRQPPPQTAAKQQSPNLVEPELSYPEQAHTPIMPGAAEKASPSPARHRDTSHSPFPEQQRSPRTSAHNSETLDPNAGKPSGFNTLFRKLSSKKYKNSSPTSSTDAAHTNEGNSEHSVSFAKNTTPTPKDSHLSAKADPLVRRGVSMKVTAKEKSNSSSRSIINDETKRTKAAYDHPESTPRTHARSSSTSGKPHGFMPGEVLPPLPNINTNFSGAYQQGSEKNEPANDQGSSLQAPKKFHPTARAKSVGSHARKDSSYYRGGANHPALPNNMVSQNSDDGIDSRNDPENATFDDITLDDAKWKQYPKLTEDQIIDQFNHARRNSMPSIEYPKTLFLKGFFSVQTTSTKPLPVIRYNILTVLSALGVKFHEVKGGFVCVHSASLPPQEQQSDDDAPDVDTIIDGYRSDDNSEEKRLYGDAFKSSSNSLSKEKGSEGDTHTPENETETLTVPQIVTPQPPAKSLSRKSSLHNNGPSSPTAFVKGHKHSSSTSGTHRRKFSVGQAFLQNYRKKNGSQNLMPPNTPASAKLNKALLGLTDSDEGELDEETIERINKLSYDDSVDSLSGDIGGGSDMLVSSRIEQRARHSRSASGFSDEDHKGVSVQKKPLKFEINIVKVPLVGLYGVQFKKTLGNTWSYKTLASQILNELNL